MDPAPRYSTLRDYLRVLREQRVVIVLVTLVFAGSALGLSLAAEPVYLAESSISLRDESQNFQLIGDSVAPRETPEQRAAVAASQVTSGRIRQEVLDRLGGDVLGDVEVDALAEVRTNFVVIQVEGGDPDRAALVANTFAEATRSALRTESRQRFESAAERLTEASRDVRRSQAPDSLIQRSVYRDRIASLEFLASEADPVQIVERATPPGNPISPLPVRNTILGGILGLALGLLAAFVRDSLDRRLKGAREIQEQLSWPVIGHIRDDAMGRAGPVVTNGRKPPDESDLESFRILRTNIEFLDVDRPPKVVLATSALPAEGKSTVAASLACASAAAGKLTVLIECDLRRPSLAGRLGLQNAPGLTDYLIGEATPAEILQTVAAGALVSGRANGTAADARGLVVIAAGSPTTHPAELLGSQRFENLVAQIRDAYDQVVIDSSPLLSVVDTLEILPRVDGVLLCVRATQTTREQIRAAREAINRVPERPTGVVVTGLKPGDETDFGYYSYSYAYGPQATAT